MIFLWLFFGISEFFKKKKKKSGVIPPDEYAFGDNSVFTNVVAKLSLEFAVELLDKLNLKHKFIFNYSVLRIIYILNK